MSSWHENRHHVKVRTALFHCTHFLLYHSRELTNKTGSVPSNVLRWGRIPRPNIYFSAYQTICCERLWSPKNELRWINIKPFIITRKKYRLMKSSVSSAHLSKAINPIYYFQLDMPFPPYRLNWCCNFTFRERSIQIHMPLNSNTWNSASRLLLLNIG